MIVWALRQVILWLVVGSLVVWGYVNREALYGRLVDDRGETVAGAPAAAVADAGQTVRLAAEPNGHFFAIARINGVGVRVMVDTGATVVALTRGDARRVGLDPAARAFTQLLQTVNGPLEGAPVTLGEVRIGPVIVRDVAAVVIDRDDGVSLLGMAFLRRLAGFRIEGDTLVLAR
jgi:aspartyl protease family protein